MRTKALLPCHSGGFAVSSEARLARGAGLAELFSSEQLSQLFAVSNAVWLDTAITADKMPDLYRYLCGKKRDIWSGEWEQEPLREGMQVAAADIAGKLNAEFFEHQDDEWVQRFYEYVQGSYQSFRQTPFIRLENGNHVTPGAENTNAYLPPEMGGDIDQTIFPLVKATLALNPECKRFLQETVKLREPNKVDEILQSRICKYREGTLVFDDKSYAVDLDVINAAACNATPPDAERLFKGLREIPFIASVAANGLDAAVVWKKPTDQNLFPSSDDNQLWFIGNDVDKAWFEHSAFQKMIDPEIRRRLSMNSRDKLRKELSNPRWTQWTRRTHVKYEIQAFDPLNTLHGLKWAVTHPSKERALILWKWLLENVGLLKGTGKTSRNAAYPDGNTTSFEGFSVLGIHVSENAWIPTREKDGFFAPTVLGLKDLPEDLHQTSPIAEALSRALGMVQPVSLGPVARAHGLTEDQAHERLSISDEDMKEIRQRRATRKTDFPDDDSPNYELRSKRAEDQAARAPEGEREQRTRMIRKNSDRAEVREYLSQKYTRDGILSCQMSQEPVPFSLQSGEPYFVAVEILPLGKEIPANHLCLSPTCAAEFRHALGTDDDALRARIMEIVTNADQIFEVEIDVPILEHRRIRFSKRHLTDLQAAIRACDR